VAGMAEDLRKERPQLQLAADCLDEDPEALLLLQEALLAEQGTTQRTVVIRTVDTHRLELALQIHRVHGWFGRRDSAKSVASARGGTAGTGERAGRPTERVHLRGLPRQAPQSILSVCAKTLYLLGHEDIHRHPQGHRASMVHRRCRRYGPRP